MHNDIRRDRIKFQIFSHSLAEHEWFNDFWQKRRADGKLPAFLCLCAMARHFNASSLLLSIPGYQMRCVGWKGTFQEPGVKQWQGQRCGWEFSVVTDAQRWNRRLQRLVNVASPRLQASSKSLTIPTYLLQNFSYPYCYCSSKWDGRGPAPNPSMNHPHRRAANSQSFNTTLMPSDVPQYGEPSRSSVVVGKPMRCERQTHN